MHKDCNLEPVILGAWFLKKATILLTMIKSGVAKNFEDILWLVHFLA